MECKLSVASKNNFGQAKQTLLVLLLLQLVAAAAAVVVVVPLAALTSSTTAARSKRFTPLLLLLLPSPLAAADQSGQRNAAAAAAAAAGVSLPRGMIRISATPLAVYPDPDSAPSRVFVSGSGLLRLCWVYSPFAQLRIFATS